MNTTSKEFASTAARFALKGFALTAHDIDHRTLFCVSRHRQTWTFSTFGDVLAFLTSVEA